MYNNQHTPTSTEPLQQKIIRFDKNYVKSLPGVLKVVQLLCNFIGFICIKVSFSQWISAIFFNILYWVGILITSFILVMYTFHFVEKYDHWPWFKIEFFYCCAICLSYIGFSIFAATIEGVGYAVGFFGLCAIIAYGWDAYLKYKAWKRGLPPQ